MNCPNCGAALKIVKGKRRCEYCGYEENLPEENEKVTDDYYNLMVLNESTLAGDIRVTIPDCKMDFIIRQGEAIAKDVPPGTHNMVVSADSYTQSRSIEVPGDGKAAKVFVTKALSGVFIRVETPGNSPSANVQNAFPIMALICSFIFPLLGLVFAILDTSNSTKQHKKINNMTVAAFVIVGVHTLLYVGFMALGIAVGGN